MTIHLKRTVFRPEEVYGQRNSRSLQDRRQAVYRQLPGQPDTMVTPYLMTPSCFGPYR
jgi:hypothetical protein